MKKTKIAARVAAAALALGACSSVGPTPLSNTEVFEVETSTGTVECVFVSGAYQGGLSCNW